MIRLLARGLLVSGMGVYALASTPKDAAATLRVQTCIQCVSYCSPDPEGMCLTVRDHCYDSAVCTYGGPGFDCGGGAYVLVCGQDET